MRSDDIIHVPASFGVVRELMDFYENEGSKLPLREIIDCAIGYWIQNASWKQEDLMPELEQRLKEGFQWKELFLPHGTKIKMTYKYHTKYAEIVGSEIDYEHGKVNSPSELANRIADGTSRNAWRDLWLMRPDDDTYRLADDLRRSVQR